MRRLLFFDVNCVVVVKRRQAVDNARAIYRSAAHFFPAGGGPVKMKQLDVLVDLFDLKCLFICCFFFCPLRVLRIFFLFDETRRRE